MKQLLEALVESIDNNVDYCTRKETELFLDQCSDQELLDRIDEFDDSDTVFELGRGQTAIVYISSINNLKGENDPDQNKLVVVKSYFSKRASWCKNEVEALKILKDQPYVQQMFRYLDDGKRCALIGEYVSGWTIEQLGKRLKSDKYLAERYSKFKIEFIVYFLRMLLDTLVKVHDRKIAHKDLNLSNIFLTVDQGKLSIKLIDFGSSCIYVNNGEQCFNGNGVTPILYSRSLCQLSNIFFHDLWSIIIATYYLYYLKYTEIKCSLVTYYKELCLDPLSFVEKHYMVEDDRLKAIQKAVVSNQYLKLVELLSR